MMKTIRTLFLLSLWSLLALPCLAAPQYVTWTARLQPADARAGEGAQIVLTATIRKPWHMYSLTQPAGGPLKTTLDVLPGGALVAGGKGVQPKPIIQRDSGFNMNVELYEGSVNFGLPVTVKPGISGAQTAKVKVRFQICNASTCLPPEKKEITVAFKVAPGAARASRKKPVTSVPKAGSKHAFLKDDPIPGIEGTLILVGDPQGGSGAQSRPSDATAQQIEAAQRRGLLPFLALSFGAGLLALLTPCVFPMIPITVSYFTKRKKGEKGGGVGGAVAYCVGIISTFTVLGLVVTLVLGPQALSKFGTNPYVNLGFAVLFVILGLNLLGVFEIAAPAGLANKLQTGGRQSSGLAQPYLMGLAFTLTSFTCTAPYVGTLLATASRGNALYPLVGMLAFSVAFAFPFFALALFPQGLATLPRSGSWLVTVKAFMGMLEIAAALKFLSNADLVWQKGLLTRPVFLAIWAIIGVIAGLYLLGGLRFPHDLDTARIGWGRRLMGLATVLGAVYCLAAIQGAPLGWFEAFPPPSPYPGLETATPAVATGKPNNAEEPIVWLQDYDQAVAKAKAEGKPLLINFTGVTCTNCRLMEKTVFPLPEVMREFRNYITVELYTDRDTPGDEKNKNLEDKLVNTVALPVYVALTPDGKVQKVFQGLAQNPAVFVAFLQEGHAQVITRL